MKAMNFDMNPEADDGDGFGDLRINFDDFAVEPLDLERVMRFARLYQRNQQRIARLDAAERSRADWGRVLQNDSTGFLSSYFARLAGREGA